MIALFLTPPPFFTLSGCPVLRVCCVQTSSRRWTSTTSGWRRSSARARRGPGAGRGAGPPGARCRGRPSPPSPGSRSRWATPTGRTTLYLYYLQLSTHNIYASFSGSTLPKYGVEPRLEHEPELAKVSCFVMGIMPPDKRKQVHTHVVHIIDYCNITIS